MPNDSHVDAPASEADPNGPNDAGNGPEKKGRKRGRQAPAWQAVEANRERRENSLGRDESAAQAVPPRVSQDTAANHSTEASSKRSDPARHVPEHIRERYVRVGNRYHFPDGDPAFHVGATRTSTRLDSPQVIRDILEIERARAGDAPLRVQGSARFRAEVWRQAQLMDLEVRGYRPSELERAQVARLLDSQRSRDGSSPRPEAQQQEQRESRPKPEREAPVRADDQLSTGRLLEHGTEHLQYDRHAPMSYYVKLKTAEGEKTLWGKDLERAVNKSLSQVKTGDLVTVRHAGELPETMTRRQRDDDGTISRREEANRYHNRWSVETQFFLKERENLARVLADPKIRPQEAVQRHPNLAGAYVELRTAQLVAQETYPNPEDQRRFVDRVRQEVVKEIARGERLPEAHIRVRPTVNPERRRDPPPRDLVLERVLN